MKKTMSMFIRLPLYILVFVVLGLTFGYLTFKVLSFSRTVEVPNLHGKSLLEGNKLLANSNLYLKIEGEDYDTLVPAGHIVKQDMPAGSKVKERRVVKVIISKGPRVTSIPLLTDETLANAEALLLQKGLRIARVIPVHSDVVEKGRIIAQKPTPEDEVSETITVLVSVGPHEKRYLCPDFRGMLLSEASDLARQMNLILSAEGQGQTVASQKPEPGKEIRAGDTIRLQLP